MTNCTFCCSTNRAFGTAFSLFKLKLKRKTKTDFSRLFQFLYRSLIHVFSLILRLLLVVQVVWLLFLKSNSSQFSFFCSEIFNSSRFQNNPFDRDGEEWHRLRQTIAPKVMRPKIVEENIGNFNAVSKDAVARFVKLKDACKQDDHIPDLEKELNRWSLESKLIIPVLGAVNNSLG